MLGIDIGNDDSLDLFFTLPKGLGFPVLWRLLSLCLYLWDAGCHKQGEYQ